VTTGALRRLIRQAGAERAEAAERCDLCGAPAEPGHRHLLDTTRGELRCACRPCSLLFPGGTGHFRALPRRRERLAGPVPTRELGVPVGLAFFVPRPDGTVTAHYPSPAGATRWEADRRAWQDAVRRVPALGTLRPDVEALLVNTARGREDHWIVPVDDCFRLVALVRQEWTGLSGGSRVWPRIEQFFAELTPGGDLGTLTPQQ
jgi:Family of unknown function (DUF5947)